MKYVKVFWNHDFASEPIELFSELDPDNWETRKVVVFRDGTLGYASKEFAIGSVLGKVPLPSLQDISLDPQFKAIEITEEDFDLIWDQAIANTIRVT